MQSQTPIQSSSKLCFKSSHHRLSKPKLSLLPICLLKSIWNSHWPLLCSDHIYLLTSTFQAAYIRCEYISLKLSTSALARRPIFTSFNLALVSYQGENYTSRTWQPVCSIFLSGIKYIIIFLKIVLPRITTEKKTHTQECTHAFLFACVCSP